jgi:hypothetical protein
MSKHKSNVNPDHYKTAGREPIGRAVNQGIERQVFAQSLVREKKIDPWGFQPPKPEIERTTKREMNGPSKQADGRRAKAITADAGQGSAKSGTRSTGQKISAARHKNRPVPAAKKVAGAFGREGGRRHSRKSTNARTRKTVA